MADEAELVETGDPAADLHRLDEEVRRAARALDLDLGRLLARQLALAVEVEQPDEPREAGLERDVEVEDDVLHPLEPADRLAVELDPLAGVRPAAVERERGGRQRE